MQVNYGYIQDNKIIAPVAMRSRFNNIGAWHTLTDEERANHKWYPCDVINEQYSPITQHRSQPQYSFDGKRITVTYTVTDKTLDEIKEDFKKQLADHRWTIETRGITVFGNSIKTDRESQATLSAAYTSLKNGLLTQTDWKSDSGWTTVTLVELEPIASAVANHVSQCFSAEKTVSNSIDLLTLETVGQFDVIREFNTVMGISGTESI